MARTTKLTDKDMSVLQEQDAPKEQHKQTRGSLRDYSGQHKVEMQWDLSEQCKRDLIFKLVIDNDTEVLLDVEQFRRYARWV